MAAGMDISGHNAKGTSEVLLNFENSFCFVNVVRGGFGLSVFCSEY